MTNMTRDTYASTTQATPTESAYDIGCGDVGLFESEKYTNQGNESLSRSKEFMDEYYRGYYDCGGDVSPTEKGFEPYKHSQFYQPQPSEPLDTLQPSLQSMQGGIDWITVCNNLQSALVSSCGILVNSDNTLPTEGERAVGCIRNGIALAGGGTLLASLPLPLIISALKALEEPTGCGGIVEWGAIGNVGDLQEIISLLT